jgi:hypothetical protein
MGSRAAVALAAVTAVVTAVVSACGPLGGSESSSSLDQLSALAATGPGPGALTVGECLAGARVRDDPDAFSAQLSQYGLGAFETLGDDPAWTDEVDCATPHQLEVYGVVGLPSSLVSDIGSYADVVTSGSAVYREIDDEVRRGCALSFGPSATAARSAPLAVDVMPAWSASAGISTGWAPAPAASRDSDDRTFVCLFEQAPAGTVRAADAVSADFPAAARSCLMATAFVSCAKPHDAERIATIGLDRAVAQGQVIGGRAVDDAGRVNLGASVWRALDGVCERYLDAAVPRHSSQLRGVANTYPELYPDSDGHYTVLCTAQAAFAAGKSNAVVTRSSVFADERLVVSR